MIGQQQSEGVRAIVGVKEYSTPRIVLYFLLAYLITWSLLTAGLATGQGLEEPAGLALYILGSFGPGIGAAVVVWLSGGWASIKSLFGRLFLWRVHYRWYLLVFLLPIGIKLAAGWLPVLEGQPAPRFDLGQWYLIPVQFFLLSLFTGPLGEEIGWRGFALPALQARFGALIASLILGVFWAAWHLPTFFLAGTAQADLPVVWLLIEIVGATILYTWVFNNTYGSLLMAFLFHNVINTASNFVLPAVTIAGASAQIYARDSAILIWVVAIVVLAFCGLNRLSQSRIPSPPSLGTRDGG